MHTVLHLLLEQVAQLSSAAACIDAGVTAKSEQQRIEDFLEIKKTQLKGAKAEAVTAKKKVIGYRSDGTQLICTVQGVDKHGDGLRYVSSMSQQVCCLVADIKCAAHQVVPGMCNYRNVPKCDTAVGLSTI